MDKAQISDPEGKIRPFAVQFNPNTLEYSINANRRSAKGTRGVPGEDDGGGSNFQSNPTACGEQAVLSVRLFYHTFQSDSLYYDVRIEIEKLRAFVRYRGNSEGENRKIKFTCICPQSSLSACGNTRLSSGGRLPGRGGNPADSGAAGGWCVRTCGFRRGAVLFRVVLRAGRTGKRAWSHRTGAAAAIRRREQDPRRRDTPGGRYAALSGTAASHMGVNNRCSGGLAGRKRRWECGGEAAQIPL